MSKENVGLMVSQIEKGVLKLLDYMADAASLGEMVVKTNQKAALPPGPAQSMFYVEGNDVAVLLRDKNGLCEVERMEIANSDAAVAWCRINGSMLFYFPNPKLN